MTIRVIGIGRRTGGDDGAGPAVIELLRQQAETANFELLEIGEPSALIPLLEDSTRVIILDAALGAGSPGTVLVVRPEDLDTCPLSSLSTHGMSVGQAISLARVLAPEKVCPEIHLVAIAAQKPEGVVFGLSTAVQAAVATAAETARKLAEKH
ncbi:MAG TPA: hydrogenase maturation protease [Polyangium sp.]|nr:hydrogenase maturation protease [Polyangium sp.]